MSKDQSDGYVDKTTDPRNLVDKYKGQSIAAIKSDLQQHSFPLHVAIENYQHDYNIGSIVRNANACNVASVSIIGKRHWNRRGAMATEKYLTLHHYPTVKDFVAFATEQSLSIVGVDNIPTSIPLTTAELTTRTIYVFGQEGPGLSAEMQTHCREIIAIEQFGSTRSVNVGVASGIIMYEWLRRNVLMLPQKKA